MGVTWSCLAYTAGELFVISLFQQYIQVQKIEIQVSKSRPAVITDDSRFYRWNMVSLVILVESRTFHSLGSDTPKE